MGGGDEMTKFKPYTEVLRVTTQNSSKGIAQEYGYLCFQYGEMGEDWHLRKQILSRHKDPSGSEIPVDIFQIELDDGRCFEICMDISSYYCSDLPIDL